MFKKFLPPEPKLTSDMPPIAPTSSPTISNTFVEPTPLVKDLSQNKSTTLSFHKKQFIMVKKMVTAK